jgi:hypothetical protein
VALQAKQEFLAASSKADVALPLTPAVVLIKALSIEWLGNWYSVIAGDLGNAGKCWKKALGISPKLNVRKNSFCNGKNYFRRIYCKPYSGTFSLKYIIFFCNLLTKTKNSAWDSDLRKRTLLKENWKRQKKYCLVPLRREKRGPCSTSGYLKSILENSRYVFRNPFMKIFPPHSKLIQAQPKNIFPFFEKKETFQI